MSEKKEQVRRVFLSTMTQQPITMYCTFNPSTEDIQKKGHKPCYIEMDKNTGQFTLRAKAPHYEEQLESIASLVKAGRLTEVPAGKESTMKLMMSNGDLVNASSVRDKKEEIIELQQRLIDREHELANVKAAEDEKDKRIAELEAQLKAKK